MVISLFSVGALAVVTFTSFVIMNDGYRNRFGDTVELYGKNEFDNTVLQRESWSVLGDKAQQQGYKISRCCEPSKFEKSVLWFSTNKKNVLILGDSHSKDVFNALYLNQDIFKGHEFARYQIYPNATTQETETLFSSPNFKAADILLISTWYGSKEDPDRGGSRLGSLPNFLDTLLQTDKEVIIASATPEFLGAKKPHTLFDKAFLSMGTRKKANAFNREINSIYYELMSTKLATINLEIERIAKKKGVKHVSKEEVVCELKKKLCYGVTPSGYKAFYDEAHWTIEGAKFLGKRIYSNKWLETP